MYIPSEPHSVTTDTRRLTTRSSERLMAAASSLQSIFCVAMSRR